MVPTKAVQSGQQGAYLFVVQNGQAVSRSVTVGRSTGSAAVVVERGLAEGERVVTEGQSQLSPGARVRITGVDSSSATGATAGASQ